MHVHRNAVKFTNRALPPSAGSAPSATSTTGMNSLMDDKTRSPGLAWVGDRSERSNVQNLTFSPNPPKINIDLQCASVPDPRPRRTALLHTKPPPSSSLHAAASA